MISFTCFFAPHFSAKRSEKRKKFSPEPLANNTIDEEVETGVEDNEDMVEIIHAEPEGGDRMAVSLAAQSHPDNNMIIIIFCLTCLTFLPVGMSPGPSPGIAYTQTWSR